MSVNTYIIETEGENLAGFLIEIEYEYEPGHPGSYDEPSESKEKLLIPGQNQGLKEALLLVLVLGKAGWVLWLLLMLSSMILQMLKHWLLFLLHSCRINSKKK